MAEKKELKKVKPPGKPPALFVLLALCAVLIVMSVSPSSQPLLFEVPQKLSTRLTLENFRNVAGPEPRTPSVHAISLIPLPEGRLLAAWYGGSREGAADVAIYGSSFDGLNWSESRVLIDINQLLGQSKQAARKLGNPVLHLDRSGFLHLFVTSVALGGWATAYIEHCRSGDGGKTFNHQRRLWLSSLANLSHLVRSPGVNLKRGGFLLPVYFELGIKYGLELQFDAESRLIGARRMAGPSHLLQPWPVVRDESQLDYYLRDASASGGRVWLASRDAHEPVRPLALNNPDASIAAWPSFDGASWIVRNPDSIGRQQLVLQRLNAQQQVTETLVVARGGEGEEYSYPAMVMATDGRLHVLYTDNRKRFGHRIYRGY
jgi:predicted neuraminidase